MAFSLRPYQENLVNNLRTEVKKGSETILACAPTGSGKTVVFTHIMREIVKNGSRALAIFHKDELVNQTANHFEDLKCFKFTSDVKEVYSRKTNSFRVTDGRMFLDEADICLAMVKTLESRQYEEIKDFPFMFIDEAHRRDFDESIKKWKESRNGKKSIAFGFTATPVRMGKKNLLKDTYEVLCEGAKVSELLSRGNLTPAVYYSFEGATTEGLTKNSFDYSAASHLEASKKQRFDSSAGIVKAISEMRKRNFFKSNAWPKMMMFCASVEQAEREMAILNKKFGKGDVPFCEIITGELDINLRRKRLQDHKERKFPLLINVNILTEGYDDKSIELLILNRKTKSLALFVQMVGRALRTFEEKKIACILDLWANCMEHGRYGDPREKDIPWEYLFSKKPNDKPLDTAPSKECKTDKHGEGCGALLSLSATECNVCGKKVEIKAKKEEVLNQGLVEIKGKPQKSTDKRYTTLLSSNEISKEVLKKVHENYENGYKFGKLIFDLSRDRENGLNQLKEVGRILGYKAGWAYIQRAK